MDACEHIKQIDPNIKPMGTECKECREEGTRTVQLRMCLVCGHLGCCDSSEGMHATKHFQQTGHAVMTAFPDRKWKWCYVDKKYL